MRADRVRQDRNGVVLAVEIARSIDLGAYVRLHLNGAVPLVAHLSHPAFTELKPRGQASLVAVVPREAVHVLSASPVEASVSSSNQE